MWATNMLEAILYGGVARALPPVSVLTARERLVVQLGARDPLWSLHAQGWRQRLTALLVGAQRRNRLADPRLEALRRAAVLAAHDRLDAAELNHLAASGLSRDALDEIRSGSIIKLPCHPAAAT